MCSAAKLFLGCLLLPFLIPAAAEGAVVTFFDGTFNDADWERDVFEIVNGGTVVATQEAAGGNPGEYLHIINTVAAGAAGSAVYGLYIKPSASYTPSTQGAIIDGTLSIDTQMFAGFGDGETTRTLLRQDGNLFIRVGMRIDANNVGSWMTKGQTFTASNFQMISQTGPGVLVFDPTNHPDFSDSGSTIEFGFSTADSTQFTTGYTIDGGFDNWRVTLNTVPEPTSLVLLAVGGAIVLGGGRLASRRGSRWEQ